MRTNRASKEEMPELNRESVVQWSRQPVAAEVGQEVVLMSLERGRCYGLGPVGTDLWKNLREPIRVERLIEKLLDEYAAEADVLAEDVIATLKQYAEEGLIEVSEGA